MIENIKVQVFETPAKYFEIWFSEGQWGRQIEAKVKAYDIDQAIEWVKKTYTGYEYQEELGDDQVCYLTINVCKYDQCPFENEELREKETEKEDGFDPCWSCERSMNFEIVEVEDIEESLMLILPTCHSRATKGIGFLDNEAFHDLTVEETD